MKWSTHSILLVSWLAQSAICASLWAEAAVVRQAEPNSVYDVRGILNSIDPASRQVVIAHEPIAGYMGAMTMNFDVADMAELTLLKAGDAVTFRLSVTSEKAWIDRLKKAATSPLLPFTPAPARPAHELALGEALPEFEFVNEAGEKHGLKELQGQTLAITFIYTRCPLPTYCPLVNRHFQTAQNLVDRILPNNKCRFLSVSIDPQHDTPEVLAAYAKEYATDRARWNFVVTDSDSLRMVGDSVGLEIKRSGEQVDHNLRTVVIDASGRIRHIFRGNTWTPQELAAAMRAAARKFEI